jgi:hypothetical protein
MKAKFMGSSFLQDSLGLLSPIPHAKAGVNHPIMEGGMNQPIEEDFEKDHGDSDS